jgi:hypothetical protein
MFDRLPLLTTVRMTKADMEPRKGCSEEGTNVEIIIQLVQNAVFFPRV